MQKFSFRLQKVLEHRIDVEEEKKRSFVKARNDYLREKEKLETLKRRLHEFSFEEFEKNTGIFTYIARYNYIAFLEERIEEQEKRLKLFEKAVNEKRHEFEESKKDRKVLDKLKENALKDYRINMDRLEQKQNDEFALYGYMRK